MHRLAELRLWLLNTLLSALYLLPLLLCWWLNCPYQRSLLLTVALAAALSWWLSWRRYRLIADTPTSKLASASQGYVELFGYCDLLPGAQPLGFANLPPAVWLRYSVYRRSGDFWWRSRAGVSSETFLLRDQSGRCVIDPEGAEVYGAQRRRWSEGEWVYDVSFLHLGEPLYAIGELTTLSGATQALDKRADLIALLQEWKRDPVRLLRRFDRNGDGQIDLAEWQLVRKAAERKVARQHAEIRIQAETHLLRASRGRPFILSNRNPAQLARRYRLWAVGHGCIAVISGYFSLV